MSLVGFDYSLGSGFNDFFLELSSPEKNQGRSCRNDPFWGIIGFRWVVTTKPPTSFTFWSEHRTNNSKFVPQQAQENVQSIGIISKMFDTNINFLPRNDPKQYGVTVCNSFWDLLSYISNMDLIFPATHPCRIWRNDCKSFESFLHFFRKILVFFCQGRINHNDIYIVWTCYWTKSLWMQLMLGLIRLSLSSPKPWVPNHPSESPYQQVRPWKWMIGRLTTFLLGFGPFSGAFLAVSSAESGIWPTPSKSRRLATPMILRPRAPQKKTFKKIIGSPPNWRRKRCIKVVFVCFLFPKKKQHFFLGKKGRKKSTWKIYQICWVLNPRIQANLVIRRWVNLWILRELCLVDGQINQTLRLQWEQPPLFTKILGS